MQVWINGQARRFPELAGQATLDKLIALLANQGDRVAVEQNGEIVPRASWPGSSVQEGDRLEIVHFVGGGAC